MFNLLGFTHVFDMGISLFLWYLLWHCLCTPKFYPKYFYPKYSKFFFSVHTRRVEIGHILSRRSWLYIYVVHFHMFPIRLIHYLSDMLTQTCFFFFESQGVNWTQCWSIWMLSWVNLRTRTANVLRCIVKRLGKHRLNVSTVADLHLIYIR